MRSRTRTRCARFVGALALAGVAVFPSVIPRMGAPSALAGAVKNKNRRQNRRVGDTPRRAKPREEHNGGQDDSPTALGIPIIGGGFADSNRDGVVDLVDFDEFERCRTQAGGGAISADCLVFDADANARLDLHDWRAFQIAFTGSSPPGHTISGFVLDTSDQQDGAGLEGVVMVFSGGLLSAKVTTDQNGVYSMNVPYGWNGTVSARAAQVSFDPPMAQYANVVSNQTQDFIARHNDLPIAGSVFRGDNVTLATERPITLVFRDERDTLLRTIVTRNGRYQTTVPVGPDGIRRTGTVTASGPDVRFEQASRVFSVSRTSDTGPSFVVFYDFYVDGGS